MKPLLPRNHGLTGTSPIFFNRRRVFLGVKIVEAIVLWCFGVALAQSAVLDDEVLFVPNGTHPVVGSRFSVLGDFQSGLLTAANSCKLTVAKSDKFVDGSLGQGTVSVIKQIAGCDIYKPELGSTPAARGLVTVRLWRRIAPKAPVPDALARSFFMSLGSEATDYPDIEFNSPDDGGILTWGPQGATVGQAHQVQQILFAVEKELPGLIDRAFETEAAAVRLLAKTTQDTTAAAQVLAIRAATGRAAIWRAGFKVLGEDARVRAIYDRAMTTKGTAGIPEAVEDFYRSYWAHGWCPTEADLGFFVDRAVQITVYQAYTDQAAKDVIEVETASGAIFTPAQRRRAISANFWAGKPIWVGDRLARDVAYYIDVIPRAELTNETLEKLVAKRGAAQRSTPELLNDEVRRWSARLGVSASAYGLTDQPAAVPFGLGGEPSICAARRAGPE